MYRTGVIVGVIAWLLVIVGGGAALLQRDAQVRWIPSLHFGGVDLVYALRRVAAEADVLLAVDEISPRSGLGDLSFRFFGGEVQAGPLTSALDKMHAQTGGWSYQLDDGILYVRSELPSGIVTHIDEPFLKEAKLHTSLPDLMRWIMRQQANTLIQSVPVLGQPYDRKVTLDIRPGTSPIQALLMYSRAADVGWRLARAGYQVKEEGKKRTFVASAVRLWGKLDRPANLPSFRLERSPIRALASIDMRVNEPLCVFDQSVLGQNRGLLDFDAAIDPGLPVEESLDQLGHRWDGRRRWFLWEREGDRVVVRSRTYLSDPANSLLLDEKLRGGRFEGSLVDLAGWVNHNRLVGSGRALLGGEVLDGLPRAQLDIPEGATVGDALFAFAQATGVGWYYVLLDFAAEIGDEKLPEHTWSGAWISSLIEWNAEPFRHD